MLESSQSSATLSRTDAYVRIRSWLQSGAAGWRRPDGVTAAPDEVLQLANGLPPASAASESDLDLVFTEVMRGHFEWFQSERDEHGIMLSDYARVGLSKYPKGLLDEACTESLRQSSLYPLSAAYKSEVEAEQYDPPHGRA